MCAPTSDAAWDQAVEDNNARWYREHGLNPDGSTPAQGESADPVTKTAAALRVPDLTDSLLQAAMASQLDLARRGQGRASTMLAGGSLGDTTTGSTVMGTLMPGIRPITGTSRLPWPTGTRGGGL
jgi:hypothetical protein